jgi:hypothetical protein
VTTLERKQHSRLSLIVLRSCCACIALVHLHRSKWLALALFHQLASFALAALPSQLCRCCLCFATVANGSCLRFTVSLHSVPLWLCHHCLGVALFFAVAANGLHLRFAVSLRPLPSQLCRCCSCVTLVLHRRSKWLALVLCR